MHHVHQQVVIFFLPRIVWKKAKSPVINTLAENNKLLIGSKEGGSSQYLHQNQHQQNHSLFLWNIHTLYALLLFSGSQGSTPLSNSWILYSVTVKWQPKWLAKCPNIMHWPWRGTLASSHIAQDEAASFSFPVSNTPRLAAAALNGSAYLSPMNCATHVAASSLLVAPIAWNIW